MSEQKRIIENTYKLMTLRLPLCVNCFSINAACVEHHSSYTVISCPNCDGLFILSNWVILFKFNNSEFGIRIVESDNNYLLSVIQSLISIHI